MCVASLNLSLFYSLVYLNNFQWFQGAEKIADALKQNRSIATIDMVRSDYLLSSLPEFPLRPSRAISSANTFVFVK